MQEARTSAGGAVAWIDRIRASGTYPPLNDVTERRAAHFGVVMFNSIAFAGQAYGCCGGG